MEKIMEAFLAQLGYLIELKEFNERYEPFNAPIHNSGTCYQTTMFTMRSYCWDDESKYADDYNFECPEYGVFARWYKYYTRGLEVEIKFDDVENEFEHICEMFIECIDSINGGFESDRANYKITFTN